MMFHVFKTYQIYVFSIFFNLLFLLLLNTKSFLILKSISFQAYSKPFYYHFSQAKQSIGGMEYPI